MSSIPIILAKESLTRGIWILTIPVLTVLLWVSALMYALLSVDGLAPDDTSTPVVYRGFLVIVMFVIAVSTIGIQGSLSRFTTFPVRTSTLVAYQMVFAEVLTALLLSFGIMMINAYFHVRWPIWGPVLFATTVVAAFQGARWFAEKTAWLPFASLLFGLVLGGWSYVRLFSSKEIWPSPSFIDVLFAIFVVMISYIIGVAGVARNRCGESLTPLGIVELLQKIADFRFQVSSKFRSSLEGQAWYDWTMMGWNLPLVVATGHAASLVSLMLNWQMGTLTFENLIIGYEAGGVLLCLAAIVCGMVCGTSETFQRNLQFSKRDPQMSQFLATMPISNEVLANSYLKVLAKSVLIGWGIWAFGFLLSIAAFRLSGFSSILHMRIFAWYVPTIFLGCWSLIATTTAIFVIGRANQLRRLTFVIAFLFIASTIKLMLVTKETAEIIKNTVLTISGITTGTITCLAFVVAFRKSLVSTTGLVGCAFCWILLATVIWIELFIVLEIKMSVCLLCVGLSALVVFPFAATPLAIGWNRTR